MKIQRATLETSKLQQELEYEQKTQQEHLQLEKSIMLNQMDALATDKIHYADLLEHEKSLSSQYLLSLKEKVEKKFHGYEKKINEKLKKYMKRYEKRFTLLTLNEKRLSEMINKCAKYKLQERKQAKKLEKNVDELVKKKRQLEMDVHDLKRQKKFAAKYEIFL